MFTALESPQGVPFGYVAMVKVSYRSDLNKWHIYIQMDQALCLQLNYMISIGHTCIHTYIFQTDQIMKYHDKIGVIEHYLSNPLMYLNVCLVWLLLIWTPYDMFNMFKCKVWLGGTLHCIR